MNRWIISGFLFLASGVSAGDVSCKAPVEFLEKSVKGVIDALHSRCDISENVDNVREIIHQTFIPHVDSSVLTQQVLGRKYWHESSEEDRQVLQGLLEKLLVKQYAEAFNCEYLDNDMTFYPVREVRRYTRVESQVIWEDEKPVQVKYTVRCDDDAWKVVDIVVGGLSVAQTYRAQFNRILSQGGIKRLIAYLDAKL